MIRDLVKLARRWCGFFLCFYFAALAAHGERGIRGVAFELKVRAKAAWALFMGRPFFFKKPSAD